MVIKVGSRGSKLALIQTEYVIEKLRERYPENEYETVVIRTKGDEVLDKPLNAIGSSGVFVKEIEEQLRNGSIDMAVHSMKDMPVHTEESLTFSRLWNREDNRDVLIINRKKNPEAAALTELKENAVIGTGSVRRRIQLKRLRNDINVVNIRGNVDTRLKKMEEENMDGIVLAAAGLKRMKMENVISYYFTEEEMTPSPAQGILALEYRKADEKIGEMLNSLGNGKSHIEGMCEREFLREMGGDCHVPVGACCRIYRGNVGENIEEYGENYVKNIKENTSGGDGLYLSLNVFYGRADGSKTVSATVTELLQNIQNSGNTGEIENGQIPEDIIWKNIDDAEKIWVRLAKKAAVKVRKEISGKVWLTGAGPGDLGLITVKAKEIIEKADCIIYDRLINSEILDICPLNCEKIYVGKENRRHTVKQEDINRLLIKKSLEYDNVVRLKGGDPYVFGRGGEEGIALREAGVKFEVIPGVTSAIGGLAAAGIPATHRGVSHGVRIVTAHDRNNELSGLDFESMASGSETLVFMMGLSKLNEICERLIAAGMKKTVPAAVISNASAKQQKTAVSTLGEIVKTVKETEGIISPALIVIGEVVSLREKLDTSENKKTYIVPKIGGEKSELSVMAENRGLKITEIQLGQIQTLHIEKSILKNILNTENCGDNTENLIVFTSRNGVRCFFENVYNNHMDSRALSGFKVAAVGRKTSEALRSYGINADIEPEEHTSRALSEIICKNKYVRIVYAVGKGVSNDITDMFTEHKEFYPLEVYENKEVTLSESQEEALKKETESAEGILFTCASNADRFFSKINADIIKGKKIISIGEKCSRALRNHGILEYIQAEKADYESMVKAIKQEIKQK